MVDRFFTRGFGRMTWQELSQSMANALLLKDPDCVTCWEAANYIMALQRELEQYREIIGTRH